MIASALGVSQGIIDISDIRFMLENPDPKNFGTIIRLAKPHALTLTHLEYEEDSLVEATDDVTKLPLEKPEDWTHFLYKYHDVEWWEFIYLYI